MNLKTIGVLGGMGPVVTAEFMRYLVKFSQIKSGAVQDNEYPPSIVYSIGLEGFGEKGITDRRIVKEQLLNYVKKIESDGADFIVIPCNSVHEFIDDMRNEVGIPIISIIEEVCKKAKAIGSRNVGVLSGISTYETKLYIKFLESLGLHGINVTQSQNIELKNVIRNVMGGANNKDDTKVLKRIVCDLNVRGAEIIIVGCTELSLAVSQNDIDVKLVDSLEVLAHVAVDLAYGN
ncbi:amino acid racemase [Candidatus Dojkabacteria bacterium]|nr:amino acid racemase [Candidatus Dojkabacteria bacterium]